MARVARIDRNRPSLLGYAVAVGFCLNGQVFRVTVDAPVELDRLPRLIRPAR
jgi:hypothetical protein